MLALAPAGIDMAKKLRFQSLEPRILLDAAGLVTVDNIFDQNLENRPSLPAALPDDPDFSSLVPTTPSSTPDNDWRLSDAIAQGLVVDARALVVVDSSIENYEALIADLDPATEILLLDTDEDGLQQIADYVEGRDDISAIHILAHGDDAEMRLGTTEINAANVGDFEEILGRIGESLTSSGDILIYGCNVAEGETGIEFVSRIAEYTDADVAASTDLTGHESLDGDWDLEFSTGDIEVSRLTMEEWQGLLFSPPVSSLDFDSANLTQEVDGGAGTYAEGDVWRFDDVGSGYTVGTGTTATTVDAVIQIVSFSDEAGLVTLDSGGGQSRFWQPTISIPTNNNNNDTWSVEFQVTFVRGDTVIDGTDTQGDIDGGAISWDARLSPVDLDGSGGGAPTNEAVSVTAPIVSVVVAGGTTAPNTGTVYNGDNSGGGTGTASPADANDGDLDATILEADLSYANGETTIKLTNTDPSVVNNGIDFDDPWAAMFQIEGGSTFTVVIEASKVDGANAQNNRLFAFAFEEVAFTTPNTLSVPIIDLNESDGDTSLDYSNTVPFKTGDSTIAISDTDVKITDTDPNAITMIGATIVLTNPQAGDSLVVGTLPAGITVTGAGTSTVTLSGVASIADYQAAVEAISLQNDLDIISGVDRVINVTVTNGDVDSPVAVATIDVFGTPTVDSLTTTNQQPVITGTWDNENGTDITVIVAGISYSLSDPELTIDPTDTTVWILDLDGVQTLPTGTYDVSVSTTDGTTVVQDQTDLEVTIIGDPEWSITTTDIAVEELETGVPVYTITLLGTDALAEGETASVVVGDPTGTGINSADFAAGLDLDSAITTAIAATDFTYNTTTNVLTYTKPASAASTIELDITLGTAADGDTGDETFSITLSGANNSDLSTQISASTSITDANLAPGFTTTATFTGTFSEGINDSTTTERSSPIDLFNGATVSTNNADQTIEEIVISVSNVADGGLEILNIDGTAVSLTDGSGSTDNYTYAVTTTTTSNVATITLTTTGASETDIESLIDNMTYEHNSPDDPTVGSARVVSIVSITDSGSDANVFSPTATSATSTVTIEAYNDAPVVLAPPLSIDATDTMTAVDIHGAGFTVGDVDVGSADIVTMTLAVTDGTITVSEGNSGVSATTTTTTSSLTITGTIANVNALLTGFSTGTITYTPTDTTGTDTFTVTVNDGGKTGTDPLLTGDGSSEEGSNSVTLIQDSGPTGTVPTINVVTSISYSEGDGVSVIDATGVVTDPDSEPFDGGFLKVEPTTNFASGEDSYGILEGTGTGTINITASGLVEYDNGTTIDIIGDSTTFNETDGWYISLNDNATVAAVDALLQSITYENTSEDPSTLARTVVFTIDDGDGNSATDTLTINLTEIDDPPVVDLDGDDSSGTGSGGYAGNFNQGGSRVAIADSDSSVVEAESEELTLQISLANIDDDDDEKFWFGTGTGTSTPVLTLGVCAVEDRHSGLSDNCC
jgi:hypothetical protein